MHCMIAASREMSDEPKLKLQRNPEPFVSQMVKNMEFNGSNMAPLAITYCISDILNICVGK